MVTQICRPGALNRPIIYLSANFVIWRANYCRENKKFFGGRGVGASITPHLATGYILSESFATGYLLSQLFFFG